MKTALYDKECALGAKMVDFNGWQLPLQYQGILQEHRNVRENVGLFDVSHMGLIEVIGPEAEVFLDYLSTNQITGRPDNFAIYTVWCDESGGCIDDLIVFKLNSQHFFVIVNAANRTTDLKHLKEQSNAFQVTIQDRFEGESILSLQGPKAPSLIASFFPGAEKMLHFYLGIWDYQNTKCIVACTGYTGEVGYEIIVPNTIATTLWDQLLDKGKVFGIMPSGLGARDTLRLEMGYGLYGHELSLEIAANETVASWTIKWNKEDFIGKEALEKIDDSPNKRNEYGIQAIDPGVVRAGYPVIKDNLQIGYLTSGTFSPTLEKSIGIALIEGDLQIGDRVSIKVRDSLINAEVVKLPFIKRT